jgi:NADP-dependent 3-hydroxy acid dehydrogenase YdfG
MDQELQLGGRCAVITGAASGIGRSLAFEAASRGMSLAICDQNAAGLEAVAEELRARQAQVFAEPLDVRSAPAVAAFADKVFAQFPSIALVFANAGLLRVDSAVRPNPEVWSLTLGVNALGMVNAAAAFLDRMIKRGEPAQFVITASQAAFIAAPTIAAYCASKHAMWAYAEVLRDELAAENSPVQASLLAPGRVASGLTAETRERVRAASGDAAAADYEKLLMPAETLARFALDEAARRRFWILPAKDYEHFLPGRVAALMTPAEPHPLPR